MNDLIASRRALLGGMAGLPLLNLASCATATGGDASLTLAAAPTFASVAATNADTISVPPGFRSQTLVRWGDALVDGAPPFDPDRLTRAEQERRWGQNNDMLALFPVQHAFPPPRAELHDGDRLILCANNEYAEPALMFPSVAAPGDLTRAQFEAGLASTGVSVVVIERERGQWRVVRDARQGAGLNRRITPFTPMVFSGPAAGHPWILDAGAKVNALEPGVAHEPNPAGAIRCGTSANCAGGQTPWGTYLTSEENFDYLFTASDRAAAALNAARENAAYVLDSENFGVPRSHPYSRVAPAQFDLSQNPHGPALYGWVVEIDPYDPNWAPRKRTALGRKKGECATTALARDGRVAVYMGDDQVDEYVYKFVSHARVNPNDRTASRELLDRGQLHVARFEEDGTGRWLAINVDAANTAAREQGYTALFTDDADLMVRVREAARLLGGTPMDRPEDVEALLDANWVGLGSVLVVCTKNTNQGFAHPGNPRRESETPSRAQSNVGGHILRIDEAGNDCGATQFAWNIFMLGGDPNADTLTIPQRSGRPVHISTALGGAPTFSGDRFACPDNICIDSKYNVWISTDGSDDVFADCNDSVLVTQAAATGAKPVKRFLVGPLGAEICGPAILPDERAFMCAIQHPGENDAAGAHINDLRWIQHQRPPSTWPDGGDSWPRAAVVIVTRDDGGKIND
ncbi:putative phosphatase [alpha proteobacterium U9-1i]|nr:putative phosphatase [alpha proteobacterium U9-1i]